MAGYSTSLRGKSMTGAMGGTLVGDWGKFYNLTQVQIFQLRAAAEAGQFKAANEFKQYITEKIDEGATDFGFDPHSDKYKKYKEYVGAPSQFFQFTGTYQRSITIKSKRRVGITTYSVGIPWDAPHAETLPNGQTTEADISVAEYAQLLEFGSLSRNIPARPLWRESFKKFGGNIRIKSIIMINMVASLRAMGIKAKITL